MPIDTVIDNDKGVIIHTVTGRITFEDITSSFEKATNHSDFVKSLPVLWDFRAADGTKITGNEIKTFIRFYESQSDKRSGIKAALLVSGDLEFGLLRMYEAQAFNIPAQIEIFRNYDDAMQWVLE